MIGDWGKNDEICQKTQNNFDYFVYIFNSNVFRFYGD